MLKSVVIPLAVAGLGGGASAEIVVSFTGAGADAANPNSVTTNTTDAVITIDIDGAGNATASSITSNRNDVTAGWSVTGSVSAGFNTQIVLTLAADLNNTGNGSIRQINLQGIGVQGSNSSRIDNTNEAVEVAVNATDLSSNDMISLTQIGYVNANGQGVIEAALVLNGFDGNDTTFANLVNVSSSPLSVNSVELTGGGTGNLRFSQSETPPTGNVGYSLASLTFDVTEIPEPGSIALLGTGLALIVGRRRVR
ncbi:MAG: PEP-CTERM sorting domain-containing protein [Planctomycetota bacterium]